MKGGRFQPDVNSLGSSISSGVATTKICIHNAINSLIFFDRSSKFSTREISINEIKRKQTHVKYDNFTVEINLTAQ